MVGEPADSRQLPRLLADGSVSELFRFTLSGKESWRARGRSHVGFVPEQLAGKERGGDNCGVHRPHCPWAAPGKFSRAPRLAGDYLWQRNLDSAYVAPPPGRYRIFEHAGRGPE